MKKVVLALLLCLALPGLVWAWGTVSPPNGFRGIKWGTRIEQCTDMELVDSKPPHTIYRRIGEKPKLAGVEIRNVYYIFSAGTFVSAVVDYPASVDTVRAVHEALVDRYGDPGQSGSNFASWSFKKDAVTLFHGADLESGHVRYEINRFPDARSGEEIGPVSGDF